MKNLFYIPIVALLLSCGGTKSLSHKQAAYEVLNYCLTNDSIAGRYPWLAGRADSIGSIFEFGLEPNFEYLLDKEGWDYINTQAKKKKRFTINPNKLARQVKIIPAEILDAWIKETGDYWDKVHKQYGNYVTLSNPVFSKDGMVAVIKFAYHCGWLCADGATYILQRQANGKWKIVGITDMWVS